MRLVIGNKSYSSWSLRPWLLLRQSGIAFEEQVVPYGDSFAEDGAFKKTVRAMSPTGKVPVLVVNDNFAVWDSLAICEYLADAFPDKQLWPKDIEARAKARAVVAEMHSGFTAMRSTFVFHVEVEFPHIGEKMIKENAEARGDVERVMDIFEQSLEEFGGPFLFGSRFCIADAFFAPVVVGRINTYHLPVKSEAVDNYVKRITELPAIQEWIKSAKEEKVFFAPNEPYRNEPYRKSGL